MSAHGSPTASAGDGALSGADLALRMIQAAEAAATAANAASAALNTMTSTSSTTGQTGNTGGDSRTRSGTKCYRSQVFSSPVIGRPNWPRFGTGGGKLNNT